jgi:hypothetical protein
MRERRSAAYGLPVSRRRLAQLCATLAALAAGAVCFAASASAAPSLQIGAAPDPAIAGSTVTLTFSGTTPPPEGNEDGQFTYLVEYLSSQGDQPCPASSEDALGTSFVRLEGVGPDTPFSVTADANANDQPYTACAWLEAHDASTNRLDHDSASARGVFTVRRPVFHASVSAPSRAKIRHAVKVTVHADGDTAGLVFAYVLPGSRCPSDPSFAEDVALAFLLNPEDPNLQPGVPFAATRKFKPRKPGKDVVCVWAGRRDNLALARTPIKVRR